MIRQPWVQSIGLLVFACAACTSHDAPSEASDSGVPSQSGRSCAVPPGAAAAIRAAKPRAGIVCTRYPWPLAAPRDVVEAPDGAIYVTEMAAGRVVRLGSDGFSVVAAGLVAPIGLRATADQLFIAEEGAGRVSSVEPMTGRTAEVASNLGNVTYLTIGSDDALYVLSLIHI